MVATNNILICVVGATAIGKTALAIKIAQAFNTEIVSADSRQFFKEMRIGTAVPSVKELETIPHHFIQNKSIKDFYSVGDFEKEALQLLKNLFTKHNIVVLVGGSGLYIDAITKGLDAFPEVPKSIQDLLIKEYNQKGVAYLQDQLKACDPIYYNQVDINNAHRLIRALGVYRASNTRYSEFLNKEKAPRFFKTIFIGLEAERSILYDRINSRVDYMFEEGLLEEAKQLVPYKNYNALQTVGYKELFEYFEGNYSLEKATEEIKKNTRRFAKRQGTWFRKNKEINWFNYTENPNKIIEFIKEKTCR